jgi:hypothetical protein
MNSLILKFKLLKTKKVRILNLEAIRSYETEENKLKNVFKGHKYPHFMPHAWLGHEYPHFMPHAWLGHEYPHFMPHAWLN